MRTVLLLSKYPVYRSGLKLLLLYEMNLHVVETESGEEALAYIRHNHVDLVIMDIELPDMQGEQLLQMLLQLNATLPILVFTALPEQEYALRVLKAGAVGFISAYSTKESFVAAVQAVVRNRASSTHHSAATQPP